MHSKFCFMFRGFLFVMLCFASSATQYSKISAAEPPDLILHNGKIITVDQQFRIAEALAVRDGQIVQFGADSEVLPTKGDATEVIDLAGRAVLPGLIDSHTHPGGASMTEFDHPLPVMETIADVLAYIRERAKVTPPGEWIWLRQVFITRLREQRYPTKAELDEAAPKHPVVFATGPDAALNSMALKLSGIDKDFKVVGAGYIERDPQTGEPTGLLRSCTRYAKGKPKTRPATAEQRRERLVQLMQDYNSVGITAIGDRHSNNSAVSQYEQLRAADKLSVRVAVSMGVSNRLPIEEMVKKIREIAAHPLAKQGDDRLRIIGVKTFLDGGMLTGSAYLREPWGVSAIYSIRDPRYRGLRYIEQETLVAMVQATVESRLQFTAHSVGDGAVHALLDAYEEVNKSTPVAPTRPCITHCNFMSREAVEQMVRLGVAADIQPAWLYLDAHTLKAQFGNERLRYFQPLRTIFELGAVAGGGSDHMQKIGSLRSVNPYNPFLGMWVAITRKGKHLDEPLHLEEALTRQQAIRFYTANNARILFLDEAAGSLEVGKRADLIVLDRDPLSCPIDQLKETQVLRTYLDGRLVFQKN